MSFLRNLIPRRAPFDSVKEGPHPEAKAPAWWQGMAPRGYYHEAPRETEQTFFRASKGDGWENPVTGLGAPSRDKVLQAYHVDTVRVSDSELTALYHSEDLAAKIVEMRPKEMFRRGYALCVSDETGDEYGTDARDYARVLDVDRKFKAAMIWGRLFGGSVVIIGAIDGGRMEEPLSEDSILSIKYLNVVDRRFIFVEKYYTDPLLPKYGEPEIYFVTSALGGSVTLIHESRVIRFDGVEVDVLKRRQLAGWSLSVLQRPYDRLRELGSSFQAVSNLMVDASQAVFKIQGLLQMITSGEKEALQTRMQIVDMMRSSSRAVLIDSQEEDFQRQATPLGGIPEVLDRLMLRVASAADMPVTVLFGRSPAGLNATGENDTRLFYDTIASEQSSVLEPALCRIYDLIFKAKDGPTGGLLVDYDIEFSPLWEPSDLEQAQIEKTIGERDTAYISAGVLVAEEVALSRFGAGGFSLRTDIDKEARRESLKTEFDFSAKPAELPPAAPGAPGSPEDPGATMQTHTEKVNNAAEDATKAKRTSKKAKRPV